MNDKLNRMHLLLSFVCMICILIAPESMAQKKGGAKKPASTKNAGNAKKPSAKPQASQKQVDKQAAGNAVSDRSQEEGRGAHDDGKDKSRNISNNNVNVDKSRGDLNINVDNSKQVNINNNRNTVVRRNTYRPYTRPPHVYGGYRYRCYHPYYYHPYRPFYWGPVWHPWGFFVVTLATTAIIVSFADAGLPQGIGPRDFMVLSTATYVEAPFIRSGPAMNYFEPFEGSSKNNPADGEYYYDQGVFYLKEKEGYTVVAAPVGGVIKTLPSGYETIVLDEASGSKNYYWGGTFYEKVSNGYKVVPPTSGAVVENISDGGEEVKLGDVTYVKIGGTYFQPIQMNGKNVYEVVDVEADDDK
jgi:hypothetical protein